MGSQTTIPSTSLQMNARSDIQGAPGSLKTLKQWVSTRTHAAMQEAPKVHKNVVYASARIFFSTATDFVDIAVSKLSNMTLGIDIYTELLRFKESYRLHKRLFEAKFAPNTTTYTEDYINVLRSIEELLSKLPDDARLFGAVNVMKKDIQTLIETARLSVNR